MRGVGWIHVLILDRIERVSHITDVVDPYDVLILDRIESKLLTVYSTCRSPKLILDRIESNSRREDMAYLTLNC